MEAPAPRSDRNIELIHLVTFLIILNNAVIYNINLQLMHHTHKNCNTVRHIVVKEYQVSCAYIIVVQHTIIGYSDPS